MSEQYMNTKSMVEVLELYQKQLKQQLPKQQKKVTMKHFCFLIGGLSSYRKADGIKNHMGFEDFIQLNDEDASKTRAQLERLYHVHDEDSLDDALRTYYHSHQEYIQFLSFWNEEPMFDLNELDENGKKAFLTCKEYASIFHPLLAEKGFYAWDANEIIGLCRVACACGIIDQNGFQQRCYPIATRVADLFKDFGEFAISCMCGGVYFNFRNGGSDDQVKDCYVLFKQIMDLLFASEYAWKNNPWLIIEPKNFYIKEEKLLHLLHDWEGGDGCIVSDRIMVDGANVGYMYRVKPEYEWDSGWRFLAGDEDKEYLNNPLHTGIYKLNTVVNYDPAIQSYLTEEYGSIFAKKEDLLFHKIK